MLPLAAGVGIQQVDEEALAEAAQSYLRGEGIVSGSGSDSVDMNPMPGSSPEGGGAMAPSPDGNGGMAPNTPPGDQPYGGDGGTAQPTMTLEQTDNGLWQLVITFLGTPAGQAAANKLLEQTQSHPEELQVALQGAPLESGGSATIDTAAVHRKRCAAAGAAAAVDGATCTAPACNNKRPLPSLCLQRLELGWLCPHRCDRGGRGGRRG